MLPVPFGMDLLILSLYEVYASYEATGDWCTLFAVIHGNEYVFIVIAIHCHVTVVIRRQDFHHRMCCTDMNFFIHV